MLESPILAPAVAARHPEIKTYTGKGETHKGYTVRLSFTASGFDAIILGVGGDAIYYTKASAKPTEAVYAAYFARDAKRSDTAKPFSATDKCGSIAPAINTQQSTKTDRQGRLTVIANNTGTTLRTFRLALAATGEFTAQKGAGNVTTAFNALVGYVNRMNAVYRTELSVAFTLVSDESLVFPNAATDPYTNTDQSKMLDENQAKIDLAIGNANYDVGHVLGTAGGSGGGVAVTPSVCVTGSKAQGASGVGDGSFAAVFDDQLISHEIGHQFGMSHTFNSSLPVCTTREATTSVEPGAGTTIMSYGYTCDNSTGNDNYETPAYQPFLNFHTVSYQQAATYINTLSCFSSTVLTNLVPVISGLPASTTIPKSTPFTLSATGSDGNAGDVLTYSWEGTNIGTIVPDGTTLPNTALPPFFRSYQPVSTGTRYFPRLSAILDGTNYAKGDKLPSVGITTTHRLTVRDNAGGLTYSEVVVTVDGNSGPFLETTNLVGAYPGNSTKTITWSVANTTAAPVNCANVDILLSTDGGQTFPTILVANTPNDGSEPVVLPAVLTTTARIKVVSSNNIFFDISNANFSITAPEVVALAVNLTASPTAILTTGTTTLSATVSGGTTPYIYAFSGPGTITQVNTSANTATVTGLVAGVQTFTVTATDATSPTTQSIMGTVNVTVTAPVPVVGLTSPDSVATEGGGRVNLVAGTNLVLKRSRVASGNSDVTYSDPATLRFERNNTVGELVVRYSLGGSAAGGNDYVALPGSVTFANGESVQLVEVDPIDDESAEGDETLVVTMIDGADYDPIKADDSATITIKDNDSVAPTGPATLTITSFNCFSTNGALSSVDFVVGYSDGTFTPALPLLFINGVTNKGVLGQSYSFPFDQNVSTLTIADQDTYAPYFTWNFRNACATPTTPPTPPVPPTGPATLTITSFNCYTTNGALSSVDFVVGYTDGTFTPALPLLFINGVTDKGALGQSYTFPFDQNQNTLPIADQASRSVYFVWNFRNACAGPVTPPTPPVPPTGPATLTITSFNCYTTNGALSSVDFVVGYTDGTFTPALPLLFINGVTDKGALGQSYTFPFDQNQNTLPIADQASRSVYFVWNFRNACATKVGQPFPFRLAAEPVTPLQVHVLGNPVGDAVEVEVTGAEGSSLNLYLTDIQGRAVAQHRVEQARAVEPVRFVVKQQPTGVLLLRTATPTQTKLIRILKAD